LSGIEFLSVILTSYPPNENQIWSARTGQLLPVDFGRSTGTGSTQFFKTMHGIQFNLLMAASCLVVLPVVMVFLFFQRFFIEGITLSSSR
jgi:ABC-type glycerol-3-phosphate transport system permease component